MSERATAELARLAECWNLDATQRDALDTLLEALAADDHAPTAVRDPADAARIHVADSLSGLEIAALRGASRVVDIGSGAGFPGLPLAIALPRAEFVLLDSQRRRCSFLERLADTLGLGNVSVVCSRAEATVASRRYSQNKGACRRR